MNDDVYYNYFIILMANQIILFIVIRLDSINYYDHMIYNSNNHKLIAYTKMKWIKSSPTNMSGY